MTAVPREDHPGGDFDVSVAGEIDGAIDEEDVTRRSVDNLAHELAGRIDGVGGTGWRPIGDVGRTTTHLDRARIGQVTIGSGGRLSRC